MFVAKKSGLRAPRSGSKKPLAQEEITWPDFTTKSGATLSIEYYKVMGTRWIFVLFVSFFQLALCSDLFVFHSCISYINICKASVSEIKGTIHWAYNHHSILSGWDTITASSDPQHLASSISSVFGTPSWHPHYLDLFGTPSWHPHYLDLFGNDGSHFTYRKVWLYTRKMAPTKASNNWSNKKPLQSAVFFPVLIQKQCNIHLYKVMGPHTFTFLYQKIALKSKYSGLKSGLYQSPLYIYLWGMFRPFWIAPLRRLGGAPATRNLWLVESKTLYQYPPWASCVVASIRNVSMDFIPIPLQSQARHRTHPFKEGCLSYDLVWMWRLMLLQHIVLLSGNSDNIHFSTYTYVVSRGGSVSQTMSDGTTYFCILLHV